jgi:hypothetical protein
VTRYLSLKGPPLGELTPCSCVGREVRIGTCGTTNFWHYIGCPHMHHWEPLASMWTTNPYRLEDKDILDAVSW